MVSFKQKTRATEGHIIVTIIVMSLFFFFSFFVVDEKHAPGLLVLTCFFNVDSSWVILTVIILVLKFFCFEKKFAAENLSPKFSDVIKVL